MSFFRQKKRGAVIVGMSGGVDSAVTAWLLQQQGYTVYGATAIFWPESLCCGDESLKEAKRTADQLGIPHKLINVIPEFGSQVIQPFVDAYYAGQTPNPCTVCNRQVKFGAFFDKALLEYGLPADTKFATGHYARIVKQKDRYMIKRGNDRLKDQSYMLYALTQIELARTLLPLGGLKKTKVRALSAQLGWKVHERPESQDACFTMGDYKKFIVEFSGKDPVPGNFVLRDGTILGTHKGLPFYTVGQRRGLGLAYSEPLYVLALSVAHNEVIVGTKQEQGSQTFYVTELQWLNPLSRPFVAAIKVRYNSPAVKGYVYPAEKRVWLTRPVDAVTPGQAAVFYRGDTVVGGGIIREA